MGNPSTRAHNKYNLKAYDRINLTVYKGQKDIIQSHAAARGESVNGFINRAISEQMERDRETDVATPDDVEAVNAAREEYANGETIPHDAINWD